MFYNVRAKMQRWQLVCRVGEEFAPTAGRTPLWARAGNNVPNACDFGILRACRLESKARLREKQLKTGFGRAYLKRRL
jgi:hypothetical protein